MNKASEEEFRQTTDFNCGPAAVAFMLRTHEEHPRSIDEITKIMGSTDEAGTSHEQIEAYLRGRGYVFSSGTPSLFALRLPMLVNHQSEEDGHYSVILSITLAYTNAHIRLFDPADGKIKTRAWGFFLESWYSARYGAKWGLWGLTRPK